MSGGDPDTAVPDHRTSAGGGGGSPRYPLDGSGRPRDVQPRSWRLIKPTGPELLALQSIRHRAGSALAGTSAAMLATDLATTRTTAGRIIDRLALKGWIVSDSRRMQWIPTSFAGLALRMHDVARLVGLVAALVRAPIPGVPRTVVELARSLAVDAGPSRGCVSHPSAINGNNDTSHGERTRAGLRRWQRQRLDARTIPAVKAARQQLAASASAA